MLILVSGINHPFDCLNNALISSDKTDQQILECMGRLANKFGGALSRPFPKDWLLVSGTEDNPLSVELLDELSRKFPLPEGMKCQ